MQFTIITNQEVIDYLREYVVNSKRVNRQVSSQRLLKTIDSGVNEILLAFKNEHGERVLGIKDSRGGLFWAGDESDWEPCFMGSEMRFLTNQINTWN